MNNIFILSHVAQRGKEKEESERKTFAFFADLKAAFDNVDRNTLWKIIREQGLDEILLVRRLEKIYERTEVMVRTNEGTTEGFETRKGVRQGCVLSPLMFNLYIAGLERKFKERQIGGIEIGRERVWSLAYADDIVLLARNKEALEDMMGTFSNFLRTRKLELSVEKSKVLIFGKGSREKRVKLKWRGKDIEEVKEFKYLGFMFNNKGNYVEHIKELMRKGRMAIKKVWGLGERICKNDFIRRWNLFKYLAQSVMSYGVEIWGWEEREGLEKIMMDYIRWLFKLDFCTPRYIIGREIGMEKLRLGWGIRAKRFEEKVCRGEDRIMKECWKEKEAEGWRDLYGKERKDFYDRYGLTIDRMEAGDRDKREEEIVEKERRERREEENRRIEEARYNVRYKEIITEGKVPRYLLKESIERVELGEGVRALAKLRCENMEEWNKYWLEEGKRKCSFCGEGKDDMCHFIRNCKEVKEWFRVLGDNEEEIWRRVWDDELDGEKSNLLVKIWKEKERLKKGKICKVEGSMK